MSLRDDYLKYLDTFGHQEKRSMFGGIGVFSEGAMFAIVTHSSLYIRGGEALDFQLTRLGCEKFKHIKKGNTATVNYYEVTELYLNDKNKCDKLVTHSMSLSSQDKAFRCSDASRRLRDLPNMRLALERMVKKAGIQDIEAFRAAGAVNVFRRVCHYHGQELDLKLLWIFASAIAGIHWQLLGEEKKQRLLNEYHQCKVD